MTNHDEADSLAIKVQLAFEDASHRVIERARAANTPAIHSVPEMVTIQPNTEFHPSGARLAGSKNTPDPIMLPMTSASAIHSPIAGRVE